MRDETRTGAPGGAAPYQQGQWATDEATNPVGDESTPVTAGYHYSVEWDTGAWGEAGASE